MKNVALLFVLFLICLNLPVSAGTLDVGTLRGTVTDNTADCTTCSLTQPHGCYVTIDAGYDPVIVHLGVGTGDDCSALAVDDCIEVTGEIVNELVAIPAVGSCQLEATMWRSVSLCS